MSFTILFIEWRYDTRYVRIMIMREDQYLLQKYLKGYFKTNMDSFLTYI
jgi:hypothetical protein